MFDDYKEDKRPKKNGWAPGLYTCKCSCGDSFLGDKRSSQCADCAYDKDLNIKDKLNKLLYCCDGLHCSYSEENYGDAKEWLRHIDKAYSDYQEAVDES